MASQTTLDPSIITKNLSNVFNADGTTKKDKQLYKYHRIHSKTKSLSNDLKIGEYYYFSKVDINQALDYSTQNPIIFNINDSFIKHPFIHHYAAPKSKRMKYNLPSSYGCLSSSTIVSSKPLSQSTTSSLSYSSTRIPLQSYNISSSSSSTVNPNFYENSNVEKMMRILLQLVHEKTKNDAYLIGSNNYLIDSTVALSKYTLLDYGLLEKIISDNTIIEHVERHLNYCIRSIKKLKVSVEVPSDSSVTSDLPQSLFGKKIRTLHPPTPPTPF